MTPLLETVGLVKAFGGFRAVDGVDLKVREGSVHAVIGPNGAGKSTLFGMITGRLTPTAGRVMFANRDVTGRPPYVISRLGLAHTFQITNIFPRLTARESVQAAIVPRCGWSNDFLTRRHRRTAEEALDFLRSVGLEDKADVEGRALAHGDQQALELAMALAIRPRLIVLDEPTAGMSPWETERTVQLIKRLAAERSLTVVLCEHDMRVVFAVADWITVIHQGRIIAEGKPGEVREDREVIRVYLGQS